MVRTVLRGGALAVLLAAAVPAGLGAQEPALSDTLRPVGEPPLIDIYRVLQPPMIPHLVGPAAVPGRAAAEEAALRERYLLPAAPAVRRWMTGL
jgi:hypothetical protein